MYSLKQKTVGESHKRVGNLLLIAFCFALGVAAGQILANHLSADSAEEMNRYLSSYLSLDRSISGEAVLSALMIYYRYPLLAFLFSFSWLGIVFLPILAIVCGFFLSFSVSAFIAVYGSHGILLTIAILGIRCLFTIPCFLILSSESLESAISQALFMWGKGKHAATAVHRIHCRKFILILLILQIGVWIELLLTPKLLSQVLICIFESA